MEANWTQFTKDTEAAFSDTSPPTKIHTANRLFTNIIPQTERMRELGLGFTNPVGTGGVLDMCLCFGCGGVGGVGG